jgi:hypothetical protein
LGRVVGGSFTLFEELGLLSWRANCLAEDLLEAKLCCYISSERI